METQEELSEDVQKNYLDRIQKEVDKEIAKIDAITKEKQDELMNK
ncbi:hypothetical protein [Mycoplasma sp. Z244C]